MSRRFLFLLVTALVTHAFAAAPPAPPAPSYTCDLARSLPANVDEDSRRRACTIPLKYQMDVGMAESMGRMVRAHDMAAWVTTDTLREMHAFDRMPDGVKPAGWVTRDAGDGVVVEYIARRDAQYVAVASAKLQFTPWKVVDAAALTPPRPLDEREAHLAAARELALNQTGLFTCGKGPPNVVAFPFDEDGVPEVLVFVMSPWTGDAPLGGYFMFRVSADGTRIIDRFDQTRGCVVMPRGDLEKAEMLMVTHLTSATPTLFHVFMSLQYRKPVYVSTAQNGLLWKVDAARITLADPEHDKAAKAVSDATAEENTTP